MLQFKQEAWLKPYIELNSQLRRDAKTDFEKDLFKLMNNSVFGKTLEDVRKRVNIKLVTEPSIFKKHVAKVTYKRSVVFINDEQKKDYFVGVERKHTSVVLDKPIYKGFTVLELSKLDMYNFPYKVVMAKYGPEKAKLLFTDTDSLTPKSRQTTCTKICWRIGISSIPAITQESTHSTVQSIKRSSGSLKTRPVAFPS